MPSPPGSQDLTGATRYRESWWSKALILQVEERYQDGIGARPRADGVNPSGKTRWRDAKQRDLLILDWYSHRATAELHNLPPPAPPEQYAMLNG